ncbi:MAG: rhodanese-like domain protein [Gammaproteobacteria bacterium]|nr:rhodanese-like domain protein [Gammaproteobacteria bacterium]
MIKQVTPEKLKISLDEDSSILLLDVREPWEYQICHIDGSMNISMLNIPSAIGELDPERETVVICHHGIRSLQVANYLADQGFNKITSLEGGVDTWAKSIDQTMPQY